MVDGYWDYDRRVELEETLKREKRQKVFREEIDRRLFHGAKVSLNDLRKALGLDKEWEKNG